MRKNDVVHYLAPKKFVYLLKFSNFIKINFPSDRTKTEKTKETKNSKGQERT